MSDNVKYCPKCGTPNKISANFCRHCGYKFIKNGQENHFLTNNVASNSDSNDVYDSMNKQSRSMYQSLYNSSNNSINKTSAINTSSNNNNLSNALSTASSKDSYTVNTAGMKKCPICKGYNNIKAIRCKYCGYDFKNSTLQTPKQNQHSTLISLGIAGFIFLIIIAIFIAPSLLSNYHETKSPKDTTSSTEQTSLTPHQKAEKVCGTLNNNLSQADEEDSDAVSSINAVGGHIDVHVEPNDTTDQVHKMWSDIYDSGSKYTIPTYFVCDGYKGGTCDSNYPDFVDDNGN